MREILEGGKDFTDLCTDACTPPRTDKYVAGIVQELPHPPFLPLSSAAKNKKNKKIQSSKRLRVGGEWHLGNTLASAACLLSCLIHSLYHLIRRMWRCGGKALSPWDRKGGVALHLLSSPGPALLAARLLHAWITLFWGIVVGRRLEGKRGGVQAAIWACFIRWHAAHMVYHETLRRGGNMRTPRANAGFLWLYWYSSSTRGL